MAAPVSSPRIRVAAVLAEPDGILLVRHHKKGRDYYLLPGGGVEVGETLSQALVREVYEETGRLCEPVAPLFINDSIDPDGGRHVVQITFLVRDTGREPQSALADERVIGTVSVEPVDLEGLDLRPPLAREIVAASRNDFDAPCVYLGPLWAPENVIATTGRAAATDG